MAECKSCHAPILWAKTAAGRAIPLDPDPDPDGIIIEVDRVDGVPIVRVLDNRERQHPAMLDMRYTTHFATCPNATEHRRGDPTVDQPRRHVGADHPATAQAMQAKALPASDTQRRRVYDYALARGIEGVTDYELEEALHISHQSVSACRNGLEHDGFLVKAPIDSVARPGEETSDDGFRTRANRYGNQSGVYIVRSEE